MEEYDRYYKSVLVSALSFRAACKKIDPLCTQDESKRVRISHIPNIAHHFKQFMKSYRAYMKSYRTCTNDYTPAYQLVFIIYEHINPLIKLFKSTIKTYPADYENTDASFSFDFFYGVFSALQEMKRIGNCAIP